MIFSARTLETDYGQAKEIIICATDKSEAVELAKKEFDTVDSYLYHPKKQIFRIEQVDEKEAKILAVII